MKIIEYKDKYLESVEIYQQNQKSKCYLAIENESILGLIIGAITLYDKFDYLDYKCPKSGTITELIVSKK